MTDTVILLEIITYIFQRSPPTADCDEPLIPYPAYWPDLAPSDFFLFPILKKDTRGCHFRSDEEVVTAVEEWVNGKDPDFFSSGFDGT